MICDLELLGLQIARWTMHCNFKTVASGDLVDNWVARWCKAAASCSLSRLFSFNFPSSSSAKPGRKVSFEHAGTTQWIIPILLSSIHLAINHPNMIFNLKKKPPKWIMKVACLLLAVLNQILLIISYERAMEDARRKAKKNHKSQNLRQMFEECRSIKSTYVEHKNIELGKRNPYLMAYVNQCWTKLFELFKYSNS